jgi:hypothetical protein
MLPDSGWPGYFSYQFELPVSDDGPSSDFGVAEPCGQQEESSF